jgi:hypothetical protein
VLGGSIEVRTEKHRAYEAENYRASGGAEGNLSIHTYPHTSRLDSMTRVAFPNSRLAR